MPPLRLHVGAHNIAVDNRHPLSDIASLAAVSNDMLQRAIADAHEVGGFSPLLDVEIRDEEANDGIAAGTVGMLDNTKGSGPILLCGVCGSTGPGRERKSSPRRMGELRNN